MNSIDKIVGARIRIYRKALGMSQTELAGLIGVRFQQVQKYENGTNRVAASRLWQISDALGVTIAALFEDIPAVGTAEMQTPCEITQLFDQLSIERKHQALAYLRALATPTASSPRSSR